MIVFIIGETLSAAVTRHGGLIFLAGYLLGLLVGHFIRVRVEKQRGGK